MVKWELDLWYEMWERAGSQGLDTWYDMRGREESRSIRGPHVEGTAGVSPPDDDREGERALGDDRDGDRGTTLGIESS